MVNMKTYVYIRYQALKFFCIFILPILIVFILLWGKALYRTAFIVSHVVPSAPRLFEFDKYNVIKKEVDFKSRNEIYKRQYLQNTARKADIYLPVTQEKSSFVILVPGFAREGAKDARIINLAKTFASAGIGVAIPYSSTMQNKLFSAGDIDLIKDTFLYLQENHSVDPNRIGICGFSSGGSYALVAASDLRSAPLFILSIGGYYDLNGMIAQVLTEKVLYKGVSRRWIPDISSKELVVNILLEGLNREGLEKQVLYERLSEYDTRRYINLLPAQFSATSLALSPSNHVSGLDTKVFIMHDKNDLQIPVEESRKIRDSISANLSVHYSEFSFLDHVEPKSFFNKEIFGFYWNVLKIIKLLV